MRIVHILVFAVSWFTPKPQTLVYVKDCRGRYVGVYSDQREVVTMSNPFLSDSQGNFTFFTNDVCVQVSVDGQKHWYKMWMQGLPVESR